MTPDPDAAGWLLHLRPVADPLYPAESRHRRAGVYRLRLAIKVLLREFGLRCVSIATPPDGPTSVIAPARPTR